MFRQPLIVLVALLLGLLPACAGNHALVTGASALQPPTAVPPVVRAFPGLPVLPPEQPLHPMRMAASAAASQAGSAAMELAQAQASGNSLMLSAPVQGIAYGLYHFGGAPGEQITQCGYAATGLSTGASVYVGLADYAKQRWVFFPAQSGASASFDLAASGAGQYQSPAGNSYLLVAVFGGDSLTLDSVSLTYGARYTVSGHVQDHSGAGIPGVLVSSPYGNLSTTTDASGDYQLGGLPSGSWPLLATKDEYTFYDQPRLVTVAGSDLTGVDLLGDAHGSHFASRDALPGNDDPTTAPTYDFAAPLDESMSVLDDRLDCYRYVPTAPGDYYFELSNPEHDMLFGLMYFVQDGTANTYKTSGFVLNGNICLGFTVPPGGLAPFVVAIAAAGGGGNYQLALHSGATRELGGKVLDSGALPLGGGLVSAVRQDTGAVTNYFLDAGDTYNFYDACVPAAQMIVTPGIPSYSMLPVSRTVDLTAGSALNVNFAATLLPVQDNFEPNNDAGSAHLLASLPYLGTDPLSVDAGGGMDTKDYYKLTPAAGLGLRAAIDFPKDLELDNTLELELLDNTQAPIATSTVTPAGARLRMGGLTSGQPYYLRVQVGGPGGRRVPYTLKVETFAAHKLQLGVRLLPNTPLSSGCFIVHDATFDSYDQLPVDGSAGLTGALYYAAGEQLNIECYRYGMSIDRTTRAFSMPASDTTLYFDVPAFTADHLEPNEDLFSAPALAVPTSIDATVSALSDPVDGYRLDPDTARPFKLTLTTPTPGIGCQLVLLDEGGVVEAYATGRSGDTLYLPNNGNPGQQLQLWQFLGDTPYTLEVATADAWVVSGTITDTLAQPVGDATVINLTTGEQWHTDSNGKYGTRPLPPGNYNFLVYQAGFGPNPNTAPVTVTNAAVQLNFSNLLYINGDAYEPNDDQGQAFTILPGLDYSAVIGDAQTGDHMDVYQFTVPAAGVVHLTLTGGNNFPGFTALCFGTASTNRFQPGLVPNKLDCTFRTDLTGTYYVQITGSGNYTLHADLLP